MCERERVTDGPCLQALTNQSAELVDAGDIAQQAADYISTTLATVKATLLVSELTSHYLSSLYIPAIIY